MNAYGEVVAAVLLNKQVKRATKYLSTGLVIKATYFGKRRANSRGDTLTVTVGKPNYAERKFLAACKKAGEPLHVKRIQLKGWPKKRTH